MAKRRGLGLGFLDVLCSAMGGMVVLAVVFSIIKNPVQVPREGEFIVLQIAVERHRDIGVVVHAPNGQSVAIHSSSPEHSLGNATSLDGGVKCWQGKMPLPGSDVEARKDSAGSAGVDRQGQTQLFLQIQSPIDGTWEFQPYLVDWIGLPDGAPHQTDTRQVRLQQVAAWKRAGRIEMPELNPRTSPTLQDASDIVGQRFAVRIGP